jgi:transposase
MSKAALQIKNYTPEVLGSLLRKDVKFQQAIRLFACYQVSLGKRPKDLEDLYDTSFKSICNWIHRLNEGGVDALIDKVKPGRPKQLNLEQLSRIKETVLMKLPSDFGFNSATWTGPILISWIEKSYGVTFKKAQIYNVLKSLGLTFQKGKGIYPEASERTEKVEALKKTRIRKD